jgi:hypothetical protein
MKGLPSVRIGRRSASARAGRYQRADATLAKVRVGPLINLETARGSSLASSSVWLCPSAQQALQDGAVRHARGHDCAMSGPGQRVTSRRSHLGKRHIASLHSRRYAQKVSITFVGA